MIFYKSMLMIALLDIVLVRERDNARRIGRDNEIQTESLIGNKTDR